MPTMNRRMGGVVRILPTKRGQAAQRGQAAHEVRSLSDEDEDVRRRSLHRSLEVACDTQMPLLRRLVGAMLEAITVSF